MKKILLVFAMAVAFTQAKAQLALAKMDNTPIPNGKIFTYNNTTESDATLYYKIVNTSAAPINVRIMITKLVNTNGMGLQFCYEPNCLPGVSLNAVYPDYDNNPINIAGNSATIGYGYNMWNQNIGDGVNYPIDYEVKFFQVDETETEIGTPVVITYRYDPNAMAVSDVNSANSFAKILNSKIDENIEISSKEKVSYQLFNSEGRLISSGSLNSGNSRINASHLKNGMYILQLKNAQGNSVKSKLLK